MSDATQRRNPSRKVKQAEPWDKKLSDYHKSVTEAVSGRPVYQRPKPSTRSTAASRKKPAAIPTPMLSLASQKRKLRDPSPVSKRPHKNVTEAVSGRPVYQRPKPSTRSTAASRKKPAALPTPRLSLTSQKRKLLDPNPVSKRPHKSVTEAVSSKTSLLSLSSQKRKLRDPNPVSKRPHKSVTEAVSSKTSLLSLSSQKRKLRDPSPVSKRPRQDVEPLHVEVSEDSDDENMPPPPVLSPYYADDEIIMMRKKKAVVKDTVSPEFSSSLPPVNEVPIGASVSPVDDLPIPDAIPSTSDVDKFGYYKFDQLELFGDLENEEERVEEYKPGEHYAADIGETIVNSQTNYQITRKMGFGNFSLAWLAYERKKNEKKFVALKIYKANNKSTSDEIKNLLKVRSHDHIVRYYRSFKLKRNGFTHDCAVFEPLGSTLLTLLKRVNNEVVGDGPTTGLEMDAIKKVARHVFLGLQHLHEVLNFVHTDIKPENILTSVTERSLFLAVKEVYDSDCKKDGMRSVLLRDDPLKNGLPAVKNDLQKILSDTPLPLSVVPASKAQTRKTVSDEVCWDVVRFKIIDLGNAVPPSNHQTISGTFEYRAPENAFGAPLDYSFDVWSVGAVIVELAINKQLFTTVDKKHDSIDLMKSITRLLGNVPRQIYKEYKDPDKLLKDYSTDSVVTFTQRINLKMLFSEEYFSEEEIAEMVEFLAFVFNYDPKKRPSVAECLEHKWLSA